MCGIAGILDCGAGFGRDRLVELALAMRDTMVHRGPDDAGLWADKSCALAHRRLAIIDLSPHGRQPMSNEDDTVQVTYNGEIYNFRELRDELSGHGHVFRTRTDSEVLPHLFESMDAQELTRLEGMYAFGAWHTERRRLLLARDAFGKKPLYHARGPGWFAFASELQALTGLPGFDATIDPEALALYLMLQYVPAPWSIYAGARKLPPGGYLEASLGPDGFDIVRTGRHFEFDAGRRGAEIPRSREARLEALRETLQRAVERRLVSDVPLGAFLSGGVDSSLVVAMMARELGREVKTFSIGFAGTDESEHEYARQVAKLLGTDHHDRIIEIDAVHMAEEIAGALDEPNGDSSCLPTYLLSRFAREQVTVALSGDGGDELFGGYRRYTDTLADAGNWNARLRMLLLGGRWWKPADGYLSQRLLIFGPDEVAKLMGGLPPAIEGLLDDWRRELNSPRLPLIHRMRNLDAASYLPGAVLAKVDRMSMQFSLEVRSPLLDRSVARFAEGLDAADCFQPPSTTKPLLKTLAERYLPAEQMQRPKMGFGLPSNSWSRDDMLSLAQDTVAAPGGELGNHVDRAALGGLIERLGQPGRFSIYQLWPLLILEFWLARHTAASTQPAERLAGGL